MERPKIQVDDEVREMTEDEYQEYLLWVATTPQSLEEFNK